jgi:hypothetical protein
VKHGANVRSAAAELGVPTSDLRKLTLVNQALINAALEAEELRLDRAEAAVDEALKSDDSRRKDAAAFFVLRNMARSKRRGWIRLRLLLSTSTFRPTRPLTTLSDGGPPTIPIRRLMRRGGWPSSTSLASDLRRDQRADPFDDPPFELVFRAVAVGAHLKEPGLVASQVSHFRGRQVRSAPTQQARWHFGGGALRHGCPWFEEKAQRLVKPKLFVESECVHGHNFRSLIKAEIPWRATRSAWYPRLAITRNTNTEPGSWSDHDLGFLRRRV